MLKLLSCTLWYHQERNANKPPQRPYFSTMPLEQEVRVMSLILPGSSLLPEVRTPGGCSQLTFHWAYAEMFGSKMLKRRYFAARGRRRVPGVVLLTSPTPVRGSQRQRSCLVTSHWQAYKYSAGTEGYLRTDVIFLSSSGFWNSCISLAGEYPWICCSIPPELRQGIFPASRLPLVNSSTATKLCGPQQQRDDTDGRNRPKPPPLVAQVEAVVIFTEDAGEG